MLTEKISADGQGNQQKSDKKTKHQFPLSPFLFFLPIRFFEPFH